MLHHVQRVARQYPKGPCKLIGTWKNKFFCSCDRCSREKWRAEKAYMLGVGSTCAARHGRSDKVGRRLTKGLL